MYHITINVIIDRTSFKVITVSYFIARPKNGGKPCEGLETVAEICPKSKVRNTHTNETREDCLLSRTMLYLIIC